MEAWCSGVSVWDFGVVSGTFLGRFTPASLIEHRRGSGAVV